MKRVRETRYIKIIYDIYIYIYVSAQNTNYVYNYNRP